MHKADRTRRHRKELRVDAVLGIDIAKATFAVALLRADGKVRHKTFVNSSSGFAELAAWLQRQRVDLVHACLEATGTYGEALATWLHDTGHVVSVVNPAVIHAYAGTQLARSKTDRIDAELIARFTATQRPPAWTPPPPEIRQLQALVRRLDALHGMRTQEANRLAAGGVVAAVRASIDAVLASLDAQIAHVQQLIRDHLDRHPGLRAQRDLLTTIPGIGETTAAVLIAELFDKRYTSARQAAAFAGLVPRLVESGTLRRRSRLSKIGPGRLRKALYFPAVSALRWNPTIRAMRARLQAAGKPPMVIIGAAMRKLIHLAYGVLKTGRAYEPTCAHP
jgi:transposase